MDLKKSRKLFETAQKVMVGGVNSPVRSFKSVGGQPLVMAKGQGSRMTDVDGNSYTDYCLSWGALILGHADPAVVAAVVKAARQGFSYGTTTQPEVELAEWIRQKVPSVEQIRFVNSGTEATMSAIRLARGFTGKSKLIKFDGCYHGHFDDLLTKAGSGAALLKESSSLGITKNHIENTMSLTYNDVHLLEEVISRQANEIGACILEPVAGNMGVVAAQIPFLKKLRALCSRHQIVLIFDEVMTGFRTQEGCVQGELGIVPDLTCFGKIIGGGFPVGAYGGRKEIMQKLAPLGGVYQAGTFSGNPIVMQAGLAGLKRLTKKFYKDLNAQANQLAARLNSFFEEKKIPARIDSYGSMLSLRFRKEKVFNYKDAQDASSQDLYAKLFQYLLDQRIYLPPADLETFFLSGAHTNQELNKLSTAIQHFFLNIPQHIRQT